MKLRNLLFVSILAITGCGSDDTNTGNGDGGDCVGSSCVNTDGGNNNGDGSLNPTACRKLDVVFTVDPSGSMQQELEAMSEDVFPSFANALKNEVGGGLEDYRVGVLDACPLTTDFHTAGASAGECNFEGGSPWMESNSSALDAEFVCVGDVPAEPAQCQSIDSQDEQPMAATIAGLSNGNNAGFLRDDALLVVVNITDEDECYNASNAGCGNNGDAEATQLFNDLVALKGDVNKMVMLGIGGGQNGCSEATGFYGAADHAVLLERVTDKFIAAQRGVYWDLCDGQLGSGLTEAIAVINQACNEFPTVD